MIRNPIKSQLCVPILMVLCLGLPSTLMAQDADVDFSEMSLEDLLNVEVTVASKSEETVADAPSSVTVYTRQEIKNMGITTLEELLNYIPGFQSQRQITFGQSYTIQVRGKPGNGFLSKETLVMKDGQRLNDPYSGGSGSINRLTTLDDIKQVEVIRGPGSALYGSNAFLGVINLVTLDNKNEGSVRATSLEGRDVSANFSKAEGDWALTGYVRGFEDEGQEYDIERDFFGRSGTTRDPRKGLDASAKIQYKDFRLTAGYMERDLPNHMGGIAVGGENINSNLEEQSRINLSYKKDITEKFSLSVMLGHLNGSDFLLWHWPNLFGPDVALDFGAYWKTKNENLNVDMSYKLSDMHNFSFGASYEERGVTDNATIARVNNSITLLRGAAGITSNVSRDVVAAYFQDQMRFGENLRLTLGVRYDDYSDFGDTINPRGALVYNTPFKGKFKVLYGQAFRAPTNSELFTINSLAAWGNPDLKPEEVKTYELVYNQSFTKINFTMTYFNNKFTDNIITAPNPSAPPDIIFINGSDTESTGYELEFTASPVNGWVLRGTYTLSDNTDEWSPDKYGSLVSNLNKGSWNWNVHGTYHGEVDKVPDQSGYLIWNTSIRYEIFENADIQISAMNGSDKSTLSPDAPFTDSGLSVERRGRVYTFGMNFGF